MRFKENSSVFRVKFNVEFPRQVINIPIKYTHEKTMIFIDFWLGLYLLHLFVIESLYHPLVQIYILRSIRNAVLWLATLLTICSVVDSE